jgi:hypothetical protein
MHPRPQGWAKITMIPRSRRLRPMPPSVPWRRSVNRSVLSFIVRISLAGRNQSRSCHRLHRQDKRSVLACTPMTRPSHYYGRRHQATTREFFPTPLAPATLGDPNQDKIDKSQLVVGEPKRLRDKAHLKFVASQPCLVCGRSPSDPHHLRFAQPRALGLKVSDEYTVPLCRGHHRELHQAGKETIWWASKNIDALKIARELWGQTRFSTTCSATDVESPAI